MRRLLMGVLVAGALAADAGVTFSRQEVLPGFDGRLCKVQPSLAADGEGVVLLSYQKLLLTGSDVFYGQFMTRSADGGRTWSEPKEMTALRDTHEDGLRVARYATVFYSRANRRWYGLGQACTYKDDRWPNNEYRDGKPYSWPIFVGIDAAKGEVVSHARLDFPLPYAGCLPFGQQVECTNGDILVPFYFEAPFVQDAKRTAYDNKGRVIVIRYRFAGDRLEVVKAGTPLVAEGLRRGVGEPSLVELGGKYYLTLRSDERGLWAVSDDGLDFSAPRSWTWTTGELIGNANTQQHWLKADGRVFLAYSRVTPQNGHVFRNRAPIYCAQFDPVHGGLLRETELPLIPERGARCGNFCCAPANDGGFWFVTAEWMQPKGCERYGSVNALWLVKVKPTAARGTLCLTVNGRDFSSWGRDPAKLAAVGCEENDAAWEREALHQLRRATMREEVACLSLNGCSVRQLGRLLAEAGRLGMEILGL